MTFQILPWEQEKLREWAKKYAEIAAHSANAERLARATAANDLTPGRPVVWLHELPWHELDIDGQLKCECVNPFAREMEQHFRNELYRWQHIQADMVAENCYTIRKAIGYGTMGLDVEENLAAIDEHNSVVSHFYLDQLDTMEKVEALRQPIITHDAALDAAKVAAAEEVLHGILPVRTMGMPVYHAPWDRIPRFRGVMPMLMDLADKPELMHATIKKFTEFGLGNMLQMEKLGLLDREITDVHCTPPFTNDLPTPPEGQPAKLENVWFRGMAQIFTEISPAMLEEFDLAYMRPLMARCGLVYYGCCEALERKIPLLLDIPNLRKIGVSPQAHPEKCAEQIGNKYVYAFKPNPAFVAGSFDEDIVRREATRVVETCLAHGCPYEFVLKDISTVGYKPENLIRWVITVNAVLDRYY
jgi:hypothetical protein